MLKAPLDGDTALDSEDHSIYRTAVGRLLWVSLIRPDIAFAVKELARNVQGPTVENQHQLKHLLRYISKTMNYALQIRPTVTLPSKGTVHVDVTAYGDTDWAGCKVTRKSTTGCVVQVLGSTVQHCSRTQQTVALSSCEAEVYGTGTALSEGLFVKSLIQETQLATVSLSTVTDSSSGKAFASKSGLSSKLKHVQLRYLWIQNCFASGDSKLKKTASADNLGDIGTKHATTAMLLRLLPRIGLVDLEMTLNCVLNCTHLHSVTAASASALDLTASALDLDCFWKTVSVRPSEDSKTTPKLENSHCVAPATSTADSELGLSIGAMATSTAALSETGRRATAPEWHSWLETSTLTDRKTSHELTEVYMLKSVQTRGHGCFHSGTCEHIETRPATDYRRHSLEAVMHLGDNFRPCKICTTFARNKNSETSQTVRSTDSTDSEHPADYEDKQKIKLSTVFDRAFGSLDTAKLVNEMTGKEPTDIEKTLYEGITSVTALPVFPTSRHTPFSYEDWYSIQFYVIPASNFKNFAKTGLWTEELTEGNTIIWDTLKGAVGHCALRGREYAACYSEEEQDKDYLNSPLLVVALPMLKETHKRLIETHNIRRFNRIYIQYATVITTVWKLTELEKANCVYWNFGWNLKELNSVLKTTCHLHYQLFSDNTETVKPWWIDSVEGQDWTVTADNNEEDEYLTTLKEIRDFMKTLATVLPNTGGTAAASSSTVTTGRPCCDCHCHKTMDTVN